MSDIKTEQNHTVEISLAIRIDGKVIQSENVEFNPQKGTSKLSIAENLKPFLAPFIQAEQQKLERQKQAVLRQQIFNDEF